MTLREKTLKALESAGIDYKLDEHEPVYTVEACVALGLYDKCEICKNLFICDDKGRNHFLIVMPGRKPLNLKNLAENLGEKKIRFGSDKRLIKYLGIEPGHVSAFSVINDKGGEVAVILDSELQNYRMLGFHPNDNSATCIITYDDLVQFLSRYPNDVRIIDIT